VKREYHIGGSDVGDTSVAAGYSSMEIVGTDPADVAICVSDVLSASACDAGISVEDDSCSLANNAAFV
jgi:hypothetical protein